MLGRVFEREVHDRESFAKLELRDRVVRGADGAVIGRGS
jgi:hypothetical protein